MPLSISSSSVSKRLPALPYAKIAAVAALAFTASLLLLELALRNAGHQPSVSDNLMIWSMERRRLDDFDTSRTIAVVGDSRAQMDINPEVVRRSYPDHQVVMLAIGGSSCVPVVEDIAERSGFKGLMIIGSTESTISNPEAEQQQRQNEYSDYYHKVYGTGEWVNRSLDQSVRTWLQSRLVSAANQTPDTIFKALISIGELPPKNYMHMLPSRYRYADYFSKGEKWLKERRNKRLAMLTRNGQMDKEVARRNWAKASADIVRSARKIESRGGTVIFVRMPTSFDHWRSDENRFPKKAYWDKLQDTGIKTIHFRDYESLSRFKCPDTSHLNFDDAILFTENLMRIMGPLAGL